VVTVIGLVGSSHFERRRGCRISVRRNASDLLENLGMRETISGCCCSGRVGSF
jgi:hypothetical protein